MMTTVTVSMPQNLKDFLDSQVQTKGYGNVSEYIRGLLRDAQARDAEARTEAMLLEGLAGGKDIPLTKDFWKELRADAGHLLAKQPQSRTAKSRQ